MTKRPEVSLPLGDNVITLITKLGACPCPGRDCVTDKIPAECVFHRVFHSLRFECGKLETAIRHAGKSRAVEGHSKIIYKSAGQPAYFS